MLRVAIIACLKNKTKRIGKYRLLRYSNAKIDWVLNGTTLIIIGESRFLWHVKRGRYNLLTREPAKDGADSEPLHFCVK